MFNDLFQPDIIFKYGGRGPKEYDCWGLAAEILRRKNIIIPLFNDDTPDSDLERHKALLKGKELFKPIEIPKPFCLVAFSLYDKKHTDHVGVVWKSGYEFIHISENTKVSIERLDSFLWEHKIRGYYTCPN